MRKLEGKCPQCSKPYDERTQALSKGWGKLSKQLHQLAKCANCNFIHCTEHGLTIEPDPEYTTSTV